MPLSRDDVIEMRLNESRPLAVPASAKGQKAEIVRGDADDPARARLVDLFNRSHGLQRTAWPAVKGEHKRLAMGGTR